jgi:hypothetical protein
VDKFLFFGRVNNSSLGTNWLTNYVFHPPDWCPDPECCQQFLKYHGHLVMSQGWFHHVYECHSRP